MLNLKKFLGKKVCVAASGGLDSTVLLHYLKAGEKEYGYSLCAVHCEHGIRGEESVGDMQFVKTLCEQWNVPLYVFQEDCPARAKREKVSLETAAREFRRECFAKLINEGKADRIATAHHLQDEAETVLFRLARGTSLSGVKGIAEENGFLIRPLIDWSKDKITAYAEQNNLAYRVDKTNFETDATRNKLRLNVFPALEEAVSGATENLARFAAIAAEDDEFLYKQSETLITRGDKHITVAFCEETPLFRRACLTAVKELGLVRDYTTLHLNALFDLQRLERGARVHLPQGVIAEKSGAGITFFLSESEEVFPPLPQAEKRFTKNGFDGGRYEVKVLLTPPYKPQSPWKTLRVDGDKIPQDAAFRFRKEGDEIEKFGGGTQSLKKFFNDKKIPPKERGYLPLIASANGEKVYAVCGVEISERLKVTENTQRVFYIILQKK